MNTEFDGLAQWTQMGAAGGLDPLAMLTPIESCYQALLPGFSSITTRYRYYSFFCWWIMQYAKSGASASEREFSIHIRRGETLFALISIAAAERGLDSEPGIAGAEWATKAVRSDNETIHFDYASHPDTVADDRYLKTHAFRAAYGTQMKAMGILGSAKEHNNLVPTKLGSDLGKAFADAAGDITGLFVETSVVGKVDRTTLEELTPMRAAGLGTDSREAKMLRDLLLGKLGDTEHSAKRRATLLEILSVARDSNLSPDESFLRWQWMENDPNPKHLRYETLKAWQLYQVADSCRVALESLLARSVRRLSDFGDVLSPTDLAHAVCDVVPKQGTLQDFFDELMEETADQSFSERQDAAIRQTASIKDILAPIAHLHYLWSDRLDEIRQVFGSAPQFRTCADEFECYSALASTNARQALHQIIMERIIRRHLWVATRKLRNQGNHTYLFEFEDGLLTRRRINKVGASGPRTGTAIRFLSEVGLLDKVGITDTGSKELGNT